MNINFPLILVLLTLFTGVVSLVDWIYCRARNIANQNNKPTLIDYSRSFFPVLLIVLIIRSFLVQPYRVPTGSLEPTIIPGDLILVNQFSYGFHLPVINKRIINTWKPERGQIALFYWPVDHSVTFVKRVIGLPGDHVSYINKVLYINGKMMKQKFVKQTTDSNGSNGPTWKVNVYQENLDGVKHDIYVCAKGDGACPNSDPHNFYDLVVPKGEYLMMGDNRDNSDDSRSWGFVKLNSFIGRAMLIFFSWDSSAKHWYQKVRFRRIGTKI